MNSKATKLPDYDMTVLQDDGEVFVAMLSPRLCTNEEFGAAARKAGFEVGVWKGINFARTPRGTE